jgi:hypothetical protein
MSAIRGRLTVEEAVPLAFERDAMVGDAVRYSDESRLTGAGFEIVDTPSEKNPKHVSIKWSDKWDDYVCERFDRCFHQPLVKEE